MFKARERAEPRRYEPMACYRCGRRGHFSSDCYASTSVKPITCFRCGRDGHLSTECYASTSVKTVTCFRCGRDGHLSTECYASTSVKTVTCFRCGRDGHYSPECDAQEDEEAFKPKKRARVASPPKSRARSGVYVLRYPDGHVYVGKAQDIDARIQQHRAKKVSCTSMRRGAPEEVAPLTARLGDDHEAWERNETLAQMLAHGTERVRGWMYTAPVLTDEMEDSIQAQLCEKYDLCRRCGQSGHFAAQCTADDSDDALNPYAQGVCRSARQRK
jgi:predicted GIY-YIG superfamily endonuclease